MEVIRLNRISKTYMHYAHGIDRLLEILTHKPRHQAFTALHPLDLHVSDGQVLGIIGQNGAGKSTLLKIIAGTLQLEQGERIVQGRIAALLELGGGFHPDMSGQENVYLNCSMMGLSQQQIDTIYEEIVEFSGIRPFMEQPVKTYSSGMFVRLAFAVATCVEPDILIVDEALSVGDGAFARKSFNRIMTFKKAGKTILFCSHSLYQVEAICDRVIWLEHGHIRMDGAPAKVITAYNDTLLHSQSGAMDAEVDASSTTPTPASLTVEKGIARLLDVRVSVDGISGQILTANSQQSELCITMHFASDPALACPTVALIICSNDGRPIASAGSRHDELDIVRDAQGNASVRVVYDQLPLLKGEYWIDVYLLCENALHLYDQARMVARLNVQQQSLEQGVVSIPRRWAQI